MENYRFEDLEIVFDCRGRDDWGKFSFPVWYGMPVKVNWRGYGFDFNLRGGLKRLGGNHAVWPDPREILKRTDGNDLIYYGADGYESSYDLIKNYYVPFNGRSDCDVFTDNPLKSRHVEEALAAFDGLVKHAARLAPRVAGRRPRRFLKKIAARGRCTLAREAATLHGIIGGTLPVLPPDTIDVDYEVIPLIITEGCGYNCRFCKFKTKGAFRLRSRENIRRQIYALKDFYGSDLINYNSLFLGQNDALGARGEILTETAERAYEAFNLAGSYHRGRPNLFIFGSVDSFLKAKDSLFDRLDALPYDSFINVGMESPDQETLDRLGKPVSVKTIEEAFRRLLDVNRRRSHVSISCNFVLGKDLPIRHVEKTKALLSDKAASCGRGVVYLSPLLGASHRRQILKYFREIKIASQLPVFLYLAQRL